MFLTIYFCTRFLCDKKFYINGFSVTKFCTFISACVLSLLSKINVQIFVTQAIIIVLQKILMKKMMLKNKSTKIFVDLFLQQKNFVQQFLVYLFFQRFILRRKFLYV